MEILNDMFSYSKNMNKIMQGENNLLIENNCTVLDTEAKPP